MKVLVLGGWGTSGTLEVVDLADTSEFDSVSIGEIDAGSDESTNIC